MMGGLQFHLYRGDESEGFVRFVDWASFRKWVTHHGTVILEGPSQSDGPMIVRLIG